jgi:hypothetical protein
MGLSPVHAPSAPRASSAPNTASGPVAQYCWADVLFVVAVWAVILVGAIRKNDRFALWFDELLSFNLITDSSLPHMLSALGDQADGGAPLYYILARLWAQMFGATELSLRLFPAMCFGIGATLLSLLLRRHFPTWITVLAISCTLGSSAIVRFEASNVRFYGLVFALFSAALLMAHLLLESERPRRLLLWGNFAINAMLVLTHPFGVCYSGLLMVGVIAADRWSYRRLRLNIAVTYIASWSALLLWLKQFIHQADLNNPFTWVPRPGLYELPTSLDAEADYSSVALLAVIFILLQKYAPVGKRTLGRHTVGITVVSIVTLAIIPIFWAFSRVFPDRSIFLGRYFTGCVAAWAIILASLLGSLMYVSSRVKVFSFGISALMLAPLVGIYKYDLPDRRDATVPDVDIVDEAKLPILILNAQWFLVRHRYGPERERYFYPLDWQAMLKDKTSKKPLFDAPTNFKLLSGLKRNFPDYENVVPIEEFLAREPRFLVYGLNSKWRALRLPNSEYEVRLAEPVIFRERQPDYFLVVRRQVPIEASF